MNAQEVLLMDESLAVQSELRDAFENRGFNLHIVRDETSARRAIHRHSFQAAILGFDSPSRGTAPRRAELLRETRQACPVVVLANGEQLDTRLCALRDGAADFIGKPYDAKYVVKRVRETVHATRAAGGPQRILVVDDSITYGNALANALARDGHDIVLATSGSEAKSYLALQTPDAVFLDVFLPDVDGIEFARSVRSTVETRDLPILLLTGRESTRIRERAAEAEVSDFAAKNTPLDELRARVAELVAPGRARKLRREPRGAQTPSEALFNAVVSASGLSSVLARSTLMLALRRSRIDPTTLTPSQLKAAKPHIEETLKTFLSASDVKTRISAIEALTQESDGTR